MNDAERVQAMVSEAFRLRADPKAWARRILELAERGEYRYQYGIECAKEALGIKGEP